MMQMLAKAGVRCYGEYPSFEDELTGIGSLTSDFVHSFEGGAAKVLDPTHHQWPKGDYRFIWMRRNRFEQAKSNVKFLAAMGMRLPKGAVGTLAKSFVADEPRSIRILKATGGEIIYCSFEQALRGDIDHIAEALGIDGDKMRSAIVPRGPECLKGLLEIEQIAG